jgi:hypothetical protein
MRFYSRVGSLLNETKCSLVSLSLVPKQTKWQLVLSSPNLTNQQQKFTCHFFNIIILVEKMTTHMLTHSIIVSVSDCIIGITVISLYFSEH